MGECFCDVFGTARVLMRKEHGNLFFCARWLIAKRCTLTLSIREEKMKCPKCKGRMSSEKYYDFVRAFDAWKCCACGELVDPTILANRARNYSLYIG